MSSEGSTTSSDATNETPTEEDITDVSSHLPIRMISKVVHGFGRGSKDLGIPTANLDCKSYDHLPCGIYWGWARVCNDNVVYKAAISIGYNPTYGNKEKTVEPHLICAEDDKRRHVSKCGETILRDFYDETIRLSVVGYLRPELPFEGIEKLIEAIKQDIVNTVSLCTSNNNNDPLAIRERQWVESPDDI